MKKESTSTYNFFKEAATEGNGPVCYSDDFAFELSKEYSKLLDKLTRYASFEVCPYIIGKVPSDVEGEVIAKAAKKIIRGSSSYSKNEKSIVINNRKALVKTNARWAVCDYWRNNYRKMTSKERDEYIKTLPKEYIEEIMNEQRIEHITIKKDANTFSLDDMVSIEPYISNYIEIKTRDEMLYLRAYLVAQFHILFSLDFAPYKLLTYFYKGTVLANLDKSTGGLREFDKETGEDIGALAKLEGRTLGSIYDDLPYEIESYMNIEGHLTDWEMHLILDPLRDKLDNYGRIVNNRTTILHYEKIKDATEDMSKIKTKLGSQKPIIYELRDKIYTKLSKESFKCTTF